MPRPQLTPEERLERRRASYRKSHAKHREKHRASKRAYNQAYSQAHRDERLTYYRAYHAANREQLLEKQRVHYAANRERLLALNRARNKKYYEEGAAYRLRQRQNSRAWYKSHPEATSAENKVRRARKAGAAIRDFTAAQWQAMQIAADHRCHYCGKRAKGRLTQDHIVALSQGGNHTLSNIVPACRSCNSRKNAGPPAIPVQPFLLL